MLLLCPWTECNLFEDDVLARGSSRSDQAKLQKRDGRWLSGSARRPTPATPDRGQFVSHPACPSKIPARNRRSAIGRRRGPRRTSFQFLFRQSRRRARFHATSPAQEF